MPTRPGHSPLQFATVRIGPRCRRRPASTWWLYCQTASATMSGASRSIDAKTSMPMRWLEMKPWPVPGVDRMAATDRDAVPREGGVDVPLQLRLRRPAEPVRRLAQVAARDEDDVSDLSVGHARILTLRCLMDQRLATGRGTVGTRRRVSIRRRAP